MHDSTILRMGWFVENYVSEDKRVLDVGSMDPTAAYRKLFEQKSARYTGLDICMGPNVDVVMDEVYTWDALEDESFDYIVSGQAFEHIEYPWLTIKEIYKKMKPGGICCIIAPNTSGEHKAPKDCYRYFSDGFAALAEWAGFCVLDVTVSGIPEKDVSPEWDSHDNDVCLIARKPGGNELNKIPKLKYERRVSGLIDQRLRYKFVLKWYDLKSRKELLEKFLEEKSAKTAYIYGYGSIGKLVCKELTCIDGVETEILDQHVIRTETGGICKKEGNALAEKDSVMFITVLDSNRHLKLYLDSLYPSIPKYYIDEILETVYMKKYFMEHEKVYIYGAGDYGKMVLEFLLKCGLEPTGFIVSDGQKKSSSFEGYSIAELKDVPQIEKAGIIVAVGFAIEKEIEEILLEKDLEYIMCDVVGVYSAPKAV